MVSRLWPLVLGILYSTTALAELEITIYYPRTASEKEYSSYSIDTVPPDELNTVSSLNNLTSGPKGQMTSTFLRGTNSNHTLLTFNGVPIKDGSTPTGTDDIGQHNFLGIDYANVIKGPMSHKYGADAIGGVIDLRSQPNTENSITLSGGSNNQFSQTYKIGKMVNDTIIDFRYKNDKSDSISVLDDGENDPYANKDYSLQTETYLNGASLKTAFLKTNNTSHLDTAGSIPNYTSKWNFENVYVSYQTKKGELTFNNASHKRLYNKDGDTDTYNSDRSSIISNYTFSFGTTDLTFNNELEQVDVDFDTNINGYNSEVTKKRFNTGHSISIAKDFNDTIVSGGFRLDNPDTFDEQYTGRVGLYHNGFRASYSTGFKAPTLYEMYGSDNYGFVGNRDLEPEKSKTVEVGYRNKIFDFALYRTTLDNTLTYQWPTYINDKKKNIRKGAELGLTYDIGSVKIRNNLTWTQAEDGNGKQVTRRPRWQNNTQLSYDIFTLDLNYFGKHLDIHSSTYETIEMQDKLILNLSAKKDILGLTFFGRFSNITDVDYERPHGYNQLGRNFELGFSKRF